MKKTTLRNYAKLIATMGVNVKKGQEVVITAELEQPEFVYMVTEECYKAGAGKVTVDFSYQPLTKLSVKYQSIKTLSNVEEWQKEKLQYQVETLPARIYLISEDPDGLKGINQEKYSKAMGARMRVIKPFRDKMDNRYQWCIAAVPGVAWAKKLFPKLSKKQAVEKLWESILIASRAMEDPIAAWKQHNEDLAKRCEYLNNLGIEKLEYKSSNGTDFTVGLMENSKFAGGGEYTLSGAYYNPNIPSEEVFTSPDKNTAEGIVYSSKPLSYNGQLIENFSIRFEKGKAVEVKAEKNEALLKKMIEMDEGAAYLGECALIAYDSPINDLGLTFCNTLFDENASCHLALGRGFTECIKGYENYTKEQCFEMGLNDSIIHEDFMIGSKDLSIVAYTRDGKKVQIFENGNWAF
ncbi:MAG: aminopeptidase [Clostridia bacterium]|nr:aminopeptidase [Clostridia bacterium]